MCCAVQGMLLKSHWECFVLYLYGFCSFPFKVRLRKSCSDIVFHFIDDDDEMLACIVIAQWKCVEMKEICHNPVWFMPTPFSFTSCWIIDDVIFHLSDVIASMKNWKKVEKLNFNFWWAKLNAFSHFQGALNILISIYLSLRARMF